MILDAFAGDASLFTRWDEVEASWAFIDQLTDICCVQKKRLMTFYASGSNGPKSFHQRIKDDKKVWWVF